MTRIALDNAEFWELRARIRDVQAVELEALKAAEEFKKKAAESNAVLQKFWQGLATAHGFDLTKNYQLDDTTHELVATAEQP